MDTLHVTKPPKVIRVNKILASFSPVSVSLADILQPSYVNWVPAVYIETAGVSSFLLSDVFPDRHSVNNVTAIKAQ